MHPPDIVHKNRLMITQKEELCMSKVTPKKCQICPRIGPRKTKVTAPSYVLQICQRYPANQWWKGPRQWSGSASNSRDWTPTERLSSAIKSASSIKYSSQSLNNLITKTILFTGSHTYFHASWAKSPHSENFRLEIRNSPNFKPVRINSPQIRRISNRSRTHMQIRISGQILGNSARNSAHVFFF